MKEQSGSGGAERVAGVTTHNEEGHSSRGAWQPRDTGRDDAQGSHHLIVLLGAKEGDGREGEREREGGCTRKGGKERNNEEEREGVREGGRKGKELQKEAK